MLCRRVSVLKAGVCGRGPGGDHSFVAFAFAKRLEGSRPPALLASRVFATCQTREQSRGWAGGVASGMSRVESVESVETGGWRVDRGELSEVWRVEGKGA